MRPPGPERAVGREEVQLVPERRAFDRQVDEQPPPPVELGQGGARGANVRQQDGYGLPVAREVAAAVEHDVAPPAAVGEHVVLALPREDGRIAEMPGLLDGREGRLEASARAQLEA